MDKQIQNSAILQHHGILGQKWGVRRTESQLARTGKSSIKESSDYKKAAELKKKPISSLSNDELRILNNRLQAETQYKNINKGQVSLGEKFINNFGKAMVGTASAATIAVGSKYVNKIITNVAERGAKKAVNTVAAIAVAHQINKAVRHM